MIIDYNPLKAKETMAAVFILFLNKILKQLLRKIPHNCVVVLGIRQDSCVLRLVLRNFPLTSVFKSFN